MRERADGVILEDVSIRATQPLWDEPIENLTQAAVEVRYAWQLEATPVAA